MQREFPETPLVGVGAVVVNEGRVLLVRRGREPLKGQWSLPGGLVELGEPLAAGVVREVPEREQAADLVRVRDDRLGDGPAVKGVSAFPADTLERSRDIRIRENLAHDG